MKTSPDSRGIAADGARAIEEASKTPGRIASLILPADTAWGPADGVAETAAAAAKVAPDADAVKAAAELLTKDAPATLLLGGGALTAKALDYAGRIAAKTGAGILTEGANTKLERGAGLVQVNRIPYVVEMALEVMKQAGNLVLVGSRAPVAFFAYPNKPSLLTPDDAEVTELAPLSADLEAALEALAQELDALNTEPANVAATHRPALPTGPISPETIAPVLGALLPENAIVVDESVTTGRQFFGETAGAPPHVWLNNRGGSIGYGMPVAIGAAIACPDRKVIALEGDGSAMYTVQSLWTMARENLDITILVFANRSYSILRGELTNVGVQNPGPRAVDMLTLDRPHLDWVDMAKGMGVPGQQVNDAAALATAFENGLATDGPYLIELLM